MVSVINFVNFRKESIMKALVRKISEKWNKATGEDLVMWMIIGVMTYIAGFCSYLLYFKMAKLVFGN